MSQKTSYGWSGTVLKVDLTNKDIQKVPTSTYQPEKFLGGVGLCNKAFWDMGCPKVGPLDPENPLMIAAGPMTGIPGPFNRAEICGVGLQNYPEPQFTFSGIGGKFPSAMKYAGYDMIIVTGKAESPVYLEIVDDDVEIKDASELWGLDMFESQQQLMKKDPDCSVMAIGRAGENLSSLAIIATETSSTAGQGGFGAVMGSKNLKVISAKGTGSVNIARPEELRSVVQLAQEKKNWSEGAAKPWGRKFLWGGEQVDVIEEKYHINNTGPYGCPYQCVGFYDAGSGGKGGIFCAHWWYGYSNPNKESAKANVKASILSQKLGINGYEMLTITRLMDDTIKDGIMTTEEWEGISGLRLPKWLGGESEEDEFLDSLLESIASGKSVFAQGIKRAMDKVVPTVKNSEKLQEIIDIEYPAWGYPQHYYGWIALLLHVALDVRDCGNSTDEYLSLNREDNVNDISAETLGKYFGVPCGLSSYAHAPGSEIEAQWEGMEYQSQFTQFMQSLRNSIPICNFASLPDSYFFPPELDYQQFISRTYAAVTGCDMDVTELMKTGERIWNLRRAVNIKFEDRTREMDCYHESFYDVEWDDPQDSGGEERLVVWKAYVDKEKFEALKDRYYDIAGWDVKTGWPTRKKLEELDLKEMADELEAAAK